MCFKEEKPEEDADPQQDRLRAFDEEPPMYT
jgi:hypothetical protein